MEVYLIFYTLWLGLGCAPTDGRPNSPWDAIDYYDNNSVDSVKNESSLFQMEPSRPSPEIARDVRDEFIIPGERRTTKLDSLQWETTGRSLKSASVSRSKPARRHKSFQARSPRTNISYMMQKNKKSNVSSDKTMSYLNSDVQQSRKSTSAKEHRQQALFRLNEVSSTTIPDPVTVMNTKIEHEEADSSPTANPGRGKWVYQKEGTELVETPHGTWHTIHMNRGQYVKYRIFKVHALNSIRSEN